MLRGAPRVPAAWALVALPCCLTLACSTVRSVYLQRGYDPTGGDIPKRIAVVAWAPPSHSQLANLTAQIATDLLMLRKNYLVYGTAATTRGWEAHCEDRQGVVFIRVREASTAVGGSVYLAISAALYRCTDGALLWFADADGDAYSDDAKLTQLAATYMRAFGPDATRFAAPLFAILQDLVQELPNPVLGDEDILEKIELGQCERHSAHLAARR